MSFLNYESPFFQFVNRLLDMILLSLICFVCCLPIFTIGASLTALYSVTLKMTEDREGYIIRSFMKSFKTNFKQATVIWLILAIVGGILSFSIFFWFSMDNLIGNVFGFIISFITVLYSFIFLFCFPLLSKFDNTIKQTLKNSLFIALTNIKLTIIAFICTALAVAFVVFLTAGPYIFIIFGLAFLAYVNSFFFNKIFKPYLETEKETEIE